jgi:pimeloyl-ACP methyl ester carboxylesterase
MSPTTETSPAAADATVRHPVVSLGSEPGRAIWLDSDLAELAALPWQVEPPITDPAALDAWTTGAAEAIRTSDTGRAHVLATGAAAYSAIVLAVRHPDLVASLLLGDPVVDRDTEGYDAQLAAVRAPTLVIASAPDPGTATEEAQSIAGGIANGVFVIIDGARIPAHRERGSSFNEWVVAFTQIAEGLVALQDEQPSTDTEEDPDA